MSTDRSNEWFYEDPTKGRVGPVSAVEIKALADAGVLKPDSLLWRPGLVNWVAASNVRGLFTDTRAPQPPPLPQRASGSPTADWRHLSKEALKQAFAATRLALRDLLAWLKPRLTRALAGLGGLLLSWIQTPVTKKVDEGPGKAEPLGASPAYSKDIGTPSWMVRRGTHVHGPYTTDWLVRMIHDGSVVATDQVKKPGMPDWRLAGESRWFKAKENPARSSPPKRKRRKKAFAVVICLLALGAILAATEPGRRWVSSLTSVVHDLSLPSIKWNPSLPQNSIGLASPITNSRSPLKGSADWKKVSDRQSKRGPLLLPRSQLAPDGQHPQITENFLAWTLKQPNDVHVGLVRLQGKVFDFSRGRPLTEIDPSELVEFASALSRSEWHWFDSMIHQTDVGRLRALRDDTTFGEVLVILWNAVLEHGDAELLRKLAKWDIDPKNDIIAAYWAARKGFDQQLRDAMEKASKRGKARAEFSLP